MAEDKHNEELSLGIEIDVAQKKFKLGAFGIEAIKISSVVILILGVVWYFIEKSFNIKYLLIAFLFCFMTYAVLIIQKRYNTNSTLK